MRFNEEVLKADIVETFGEDHIHVETLDAFVNERDALVQTIAKLSDGLAAMLDQFEDCEQHSDEEAGAISEARKGFQSYLDWSELTAVAREEREEWNK